MDYNFDNMQDAQSARLAAWERDARADVPISFYSTELAGEVGEACNHVKKIERERLGMRGSTSTPQKAIEELADVAIAARNMAIKLGCTDFDSVIQSIWNAKSIEIGLPHRVRLK